MLLNPLKQARKAAAEQQQSLFLKHLLRYSVTRKQQQRTATGTEQVGKLSVIGRKDESVTRKQC